MMIRGLYVLSWMLILASKSAWTAEDSALFLAQEGEDQVLPSQGMKTESNSIQENEGADDSVQSAEPQPSRPGSGKLREPVHLIDLRVKLLLRADMN